MLLSVLYALVCLLVDLASVRCREARTRDAELPALRHGVRVLRRRVKHAAWQPGDRFLLAVLSRCVPRAAWSAQPVAAVAEVVRRDRLGGLIHEYERRAA